MEVKAIAKYVRVQPRKVRIIADEVRGKNAAHVASLLRYHPSKGAKALRKVLISAMANAQENNNLMPESLKIATITVDEGPRIKRLHARAMGRGARIIKKTSHITVVVEDAPVERPVKPHGTKPKARPTFAAPTKGRKGAAKPKAEKENIAAAAQPIDETTDTDAEAVTAAQPEEATPVSESQAPEENGTTEAPADQEETTSQAEGAADEKGAKQE